MSTVTWVVEPLAFPPRYQSFMSAVTDAGFSLVQWRDEWWQSGEWPALQDKVVIFHGSLGNADRIRRTLPWTPGAYCNTQAFNCSSWYPSAAEWLVHRNWLLTTVEQLAASAHSCVERLGDPDAVFVRPDCPLKPFAGRVLDVDTITLQTLDFGFYYDDPQLPVVVAPVREIEREWRFVVVNGRVAAGGEYVAEGRHPRSDDAASFVFQFANRIAALLPSPEGVYVMDLCESQGDLWLLELNPFSGADLYGLPPETVVSAVSDFAVTCANRQRPGGTD